MKFFDCKIENFVKIKETDNLIDFPETKVHIHLYVATNDNIIVYYRTIFSFNFLPNEKKMEKKSKQNVITKEKQNSIQICSMSFLLCSVNIYILRNEKNYIK